VPPGRPQPTPLRPPPLLRDKASMPCAPCSLGPALSIDMLRASAERQAGKGVVCLWSRHAAQPSPAAQPGAPGVACRFGAAARRALLPARLSADAVAGVRAPSASEQRCARLQGARGLTLRWRDCRPRRHREQHWKVARPGYGYAARVWVQTRRRLATWATRGPGANHGENRRLRRSRRTPWPRQIPRLGVASRGAARHGEPRRGPSRVRTTPRTNRTTPRTVTCQQGGTRKRAQNRARSERRVRLLNARRSIRCW
jgi:hypothetical protein